jgi:hypothetical protein
METIIEIVISIALIAIGLGLYMSGYCTGRADGIEWTRDVYNGKYDDEIEREKKI